MNNSYDILALFNLCPEYKIVIYPPVICLRKPPPLQIDLARSDASKKANIFVNLCCLFQIETGGVYGEDENRFIFNNVLVGMKAKARFKICNPNKVNITMTLLVHF